MINASSKKISVFIFPMILSMILLICIAYSFTKYSKTYILPVIPVCITLTLMWLFVFIFHQRKLTSQISTISINGYNYISIPLMIFLALYYTQTVWGSGYLSLHPFESLNSGTAHIDTLFHSSIAEACKNNFPAKYLTNEENLIQYHYLSHVLMAIVSKLTTLPAFFTYNYLFPLILIPLYGLSQLLALSSVKKHISNIDTINQIDICLLFVTNIGLFSKAFNNRYAIWPGSFLISESFITANTLLFFCIYFIFSRLNSNTKKSKRILYFSIAIFITIISFSKISVGYIFTISVIYYIFAKYPKSLKHWTINLIYGLTFLICYLLTTEKNEFGTNSISISNFSLFAFANNFISGRFGYAGHVFIITLPAILLVIYALCKRQLTVQNFRSRQTVLLELSLIICIGGITPGALLDISGSSMAYFSYSILFPITFILCGYCSDHICTKINKYILMLEIAFLALMIIKSKSQLIPSLYSLDPIQTSGFYDEVSAINSQIPKNRDNYCIFIGDDASIFDFVSDGRSIPFYYAALTGIPVINASYNENGNYYAIGGSETTEYGLGFTSHSKLDLSTAIDIAKRQNKTAIIYIDNDGFTIIKL